MPAPQKRVRREVETLDYLRMLGRMLAAGGRRVAESDAEEFGELAKLEELLRQVLEESVRGMRRSGMTWEEIGQAGGTTRQAAHQRWAAKVDAPVTRLRAG
jgi:hypothetical protein